MFSFSRLFNCHFNWWLGGFLENLFFCDLYDHFYFYNRKQKIILTTRIDYHQNMQKARMEGALSAGCVCVFQSWKTTPHSTRIPPGEKREVKSSHKNRPLPQILALLFSIPLSGNPAFEVGLLFGFFFFFLLFVCSYTCQ